MVLLQEVFLHSVRAQSFFFIWTNIILHVCVSIFIYNWTWTFIVIVESLRMCYLIKGCWDFEKDVAADGYSFLWVSYLRSLAEVVATPISCLLTKKSYFVNYLCMLLCWLKICYFWPNYCIEN